MPRPRWTVSRLLAVALTAVTLLAVLCGLVVERTSALGELEQLGTTSADHEARLRTVEQLITETHTDVRWIRARLETPQPPSDPAP